MCEEGMTEELLEEVGRLAELQFTNFEIALIIEMDPEQMELEMQNESGVLYKKIMAGRLKTEAELRQTLIKLSKQGSSPAQTLLLKLIKDREHKDFIDA